jgi:multiple antibiotic resistance protein
LDSGSVVSGDTAISAFTTLIVVLDPIGLVPIFLSLTAGLTARQRCETAIWAALIACGVLLFFALLGKELLGALGITLPAFRIGGGLLLFYTAFEMVFFHRQGRRTASAAAADDLNAAKSLAAFPLAIPLLAGPGAIAACILLAARVEGQAAGQLELAAVIIAACASCFVCFIGAASIDRLMGPIGKIVLTRLLGVLLAALAVQFIADGIVDIAHGLPLAAR